MKVLSDSGAAGKDVHPIDRHYRQLGCKMEVLEHSSETFKVSYEPYLRKLGTLGTGDPSLCIVT